MEIGGRGRSACAFVQIALAGTVGQAGRRQTGWQGPDAIGAVFGRLPQVHHERPPN